MLFAHFAKRVGDARYRKLNLYFSREGEGRTFSLDRVKAAMESQPAPGRVTVGAIKRADAAFRGAGFDDLAIRRSSVRGSVFLLYLLLISARCLHAAAAQDQTTLLDGTILKGHIMFIQCEPGVTRPVPTAVQFKGTTGNATIAVAQLQALVLNDGAVTLSPSAVDKAVSRSVVAYLASSPGDRSALPPLPAAVNLGEALISTCEAINHYWNGDVSLNGAWAIGTQTQKIVGGSLLTSFVKSPQVYGWQYQIAKLDLEANYGSAKKTGSAAVKAQELYFGDLTYSFHPNRSWSAFGMGRLYHNYSQGLGLGQIYGAGASYQTGNLVLAGALVGITQRFYAPGTPFTSAGARVFESYSYVLGSSKIVFVESLEAVPAFDSAKAIQGRGVAKLKIPIGARLELDPQYADDYLRNAPPKHRQNYTRLSLSLDFKLGRTQ
jgi:hypothetical protein